MEKDRKAARDARAGDGARKTNNADATSDIEGGELARGCICERDDGAYDNIEVDGGRARNNVVERHARCTDDEVRYGRFGDDVVEHDRSAHDEARPDDIEVDVVEPHARGAGDDVGEHHVRGGDEALYARIASDEARCRRAHEEFAGRDEVQVIDLTTDIGFLRRFASELTSTRDTPDLSAHSPAAREAARFAWATRIVDEYRSVAVFSELLRLLADLEASFPAQCAVHRLIGDELRHTEMTAGVVEWLGGQSGIAIDLSDVGLPPRDDDETPLIRALHIIGRELVVAEEESIYALAAYRNATTEPAIRAVLGEVLADEARHAAAGRALYGELIGRLDECEQSRLEQIMRVDRAELRGEYVKSARGGEGRALGGSIERSDLEAIWERL